MKPYVGKNQLSDVYFDQADRQSWKLGKSRKRRTTIHLERSYKKSARREIDRIQEESEFFL